MSNESDSQLLDALSKAYMARAKLFHKGVQASNVDLLISEIDEIDGDKLRWGTEIGVSATALRRVRHAGGKPHQVFSHPRIIQERPHLIAYYRNIVAISKKGVGQILFSTEGFESGQRTELESDRANEFCKTLNSILSEVIDELDDYSVDLSRRVILAEIGTELQGSWANVVGKGAAKTVEELLEQYIAQHNLGEKIRPKSFRLKNGWTIHFSSEPDVSFRDPAERIQIAIEIKGSLDVAGAQSRYGEAKKSFAKAIAENPRCYTVYLASCFTSSVIEQIKADGEVRGWFNLTSILYDAEERNRFLQKLFHIVGTPT